MSADKSSLISEDERQRLTEARDRIREEFLFARENRPPSTSGLTLGSIERGRALQDGCPDQVWA